MNFCSIFSLWYLNRIIIIINYSIDSIIWLVQWISCHDLLSNDNKYVIHVVWESYTYEDSVNIL